MNVPAKVNQNLPATVDDDPYSSFGDDIQQSRIVGHLLKFTKFGEFVAGQDNVKIPLGTKMIAHMGQLLTGWQRWYDNKPVEQVMGLTSEAFKVPKREELGHLEKSEWEIDDNGKERDPWQRTIMLILKDVDSDEVYTFSTSSNGGLRSLIEMTQKKYAPHRRMQPDEYPILELGYGSYDHPNKQFGEIRYPTFKIVGWSPKEVIEKALAGLQGDDGQGELPIEEAPPTQSKQTYEEASGRSTRKPAQAQPRQATQQQQPNRNTRF